MVLRLAKRACLRVRRRRSDSRSGEVACLQNRTLPALSWCGSVLRRGSAKEDPTGDPERAGQDRDADLHYAR